MTARVVVEGVPAARRALDDAAAALHDLDRTAGPTAASTILVAAQWGAPRRTGLLASSGRVEDGEPVAVVFGARYAPPVHYGVPSRGQVAQPFLTAAAERQESSIHTIYLREVDAIASRAD